MRRTSRSPALPRSRLLSITSPTRRLSKHRCTPMRMPIRSTPSMVEFCTIRACRRRMLSRLQSAHSTESHKREGSSCTSARPLSVSPSGHSQCRSWSSDSTVLALNQGQDRRLRNTEESGPPNCDTAVQRRHSTGDSTRKHAQDRVEPPPAQGGQAALETRIVAHDKVFRGCFIVACVNPPVASAQQLPR